MFERSYPGSSLWRRVDLRIAAVVASCLVLHAGSVCAQVEDDSDPWAGVEEMIIIGDGALATLIEAPSSVIAFNSADIAAKGISDVGDLAEFTPNLEIQSVFAASSPELFVRGVGLRDSNSNAASAVAVISDGVYFNSATGQLAQLFDVKSVSVLRGPQGTKYGRNASAGAILIESNKPSGDTGGRVNFTYGRFNQIDVDGFVEGNVLPDNLSFRIAGKHSRRDPLGRNRCGGGPPFALELDAAVSPVVDLRGGFVVACDAARQLYANNGNSFPANAASRVNDRDNWSARGQFLYTPFQELSVLVNVHGGQNRGMAPSFQHVGLLKPRDPPSTSDRTLFTNLYRDSRGYFDSDRCFSFDQNGTRCRQNLYGADRGDPYSGDYNTTPKEELDLFGAFVRVDRSLESWTITSITSYEQWKREAGLDADATPFPLSERTVEDEAWQFLQDVRITWAEPGRLDFTAGLFLLHAELEANSLFFEQASGALSALGQEIQETTDYLGLFGTFRFELSELFTVEAGLRMNVERKDFALIGRRQLIANDMIVGENFGGQGILRGEEESLDVVPSGEFILEYAPTENMTIYSKYVRGYKGRHFNGGGASVDSIILPADAEFVNSFETGFSSKFVDGIFSLNGATFLYLYENQQVFQLQSAITGAFPINQLINAEDSRIFGIELDWRVDWEGVHFFGAFGWVQSDYSDFVNRVEITVPGNAGEPPQTQVSINDYSGNRLVVSPEFSFSGGVYYDWEVSGVGTLTPRFEARFKDKTFTTPQNSNNPIVGDNERWLFDARLDYRGPTGVVTLALWVRNLTNEIYRNAVVGGTRSRRMVVAIADPRTYGISASMSF